MRTSDLGIIALLGHEGIVPGPYYDSVGVLTYGVGHTASAGKKCRARSAEIRNPRSFSGIDVFVIAQAAETAPFCRRGRPPC